MFKSALVIAALALAGCATQDRCAAYGFTPGTEGYANCRMQDEQNRRLAAATIAAQNPYLRY